MQQDMSFGNLDKIQSNSFSPMPAGVYMLRAIDMELKDTKNGKGIKVEYDVVGGEHEGRKVFEFFNVMHTKQQVVEISLGQIKEWMIATGSPATGELKMSQIQALEGQTFQAKVVVEVDKSGQYDDQNKIKRFLVPDGSTQTGSVSQEAAPVKAASAKKAWER